jgi:hypothetical protein
MSTCHRQILADIERDVSSAGATADDIDTRIAAVLDVPADYYFAYLLVWGAIEAYRHDHDTPTDDLDPDRPPADAPPGPAGEAVARAQGLTSSAGWYASTIYQQAASPRCGCRQVADHAARILGVVLQLRQTLRELAALTAPAAGNGAIGGGRP